MKMTRLVMRGALVVAGVLGVCAMTTDARADWHGERLIVSVNGAQSPGVVQSVTETATAVSGALQYRVTVAGNGQGNKSLECVVFFPSAGAAEGFRNEVINDHAAVVTCAVTQAVSSTAASVAVTINTASPNAGDTLTVENR